uniref:Conjugal transfer protein TraD n=1 Tax=uncultured prokaryote TaxID=198431 RepID=A0A0H5QL47_9ZZZZ|nr:hypothetical protein [uncultured prokaryote]
MQTRTQDELNNDLAKLNNDFNAWKTKKDAKLLKLYQAKSAMEAKGEDCANASQKIKDLEMQISQRQAKLEKALGRIYERMYKAGASANAKKARQERTHHLCNLGGLVEKAGLGDMAPAALLGMLLQQAEYLQANPAILNRWTERGQVALNEKQID